MRSRYLDIEDRTQDLADLLRDEPILAHDFLRKYELSWIYHENALEGVVFSGPATRWYPMPSLAAGIWVFKCDVHPEMNGRLNAS